MNELKKVVAFCPWIQFDMQPVAIVGVRVMGFREAAAQLTAEEQQTLWRASTPYYDHLLNAQHRLQRWNDNSLIYVLDPDNPLKDPGPEEIRRISLANTYMYICTFALNTPGPGGMQFYTNAADWALYFQPVQDPEFLALRDRRLYGTVHRGGYQWTGTVFTQPVECNRFKLTKIDQGMVDAVTALYDMGRAEGYLFSLRTFMSGTSDAHMWERERDLPPIWGTVEQAMESNSFRACAVAQQAISQVAQALSVNKNHSTCFVRAVVGAQPPTEYVWNENFRSPPLKQAQARGVSFSALERALDELNWARNRVIHDGFVQGAQWHLLSLAYLGSRFWIAAFKRILAWEGVRNWTDEDDCEVLGLQALAKDSQTSLEQGYQAYDRAVAECRHRKQTEQILDELRKKGIF